MIVSYDVGSRNQTQIFRKGKQHSLSRGALEPAPHRWFSCVKIWWTLAQGVRGLSSKGIQIRKSRSASKVLDYRRYLAIFLMEISFPTEHLQWLAFRKHPVSLRFSKPLRPEICHFAVGSQVAVSQIKICYKLITIYGSEKLSGNICSKVKRNSIDSQIPEICPRWPDPPCAGLPS